MKNQDLWKPTKYIYRRNKLIASRDKNQVGVGSRLMADLVANYYDTHLPQYARGDLLDLGCGQAPLYAAYRPHVESVTCVDWEKSPHRIDHIDITCDLSKPLPLSSNAFDIVILSDVLEHIPEPKLLTSEIFRIMKPEGTLFINIPFYYCIHEAPHDYYRYTRHALEYLLKEAGFRVLLLESIGGSLEILSDIISKHIQFIPLLGCPLAAIIQNITRILSRTSLGHRAQSITGRAFPFGYFVIAQK